MDHSKGFDEFLRLRCYSSTIPTQFDGFVFDFPFYFRAKHSWHINIVKPGFCPITDLNDAENIIHYEDGECSVYPNMGECLLIFSNVINKIEPKLRKLAMPWIYTEPPLELDQKSYE